LKTDGIMDLSGTGSTGKKFAVGNSRKREEVMDFSVMESSGHELAVRGASNPMQATSGILSSTAPLIRSDMRLPSASKPMPMASKSMPVSSKSMSMTASDRKVSASPLKYASISNRPCELSLEIPIEPLPKKKRIRRRLSNTIENDTKFRPYQAEKWQERFDELVAFQRRGGHCLVPHTFPENPALARWVKRQRYQYGLIQQNKTSSMTEDRIVILENIGFIWDSHEAAWQERLKELLEFKKIYGTCAVPSKYSPNQQLARWVKCQRRQYRLYWEGRPSNMNADRITALQNAGFEWRLRRPKTSDKTDPDEIDPIRVLQAGLKPALVASSEVQSEHSDNSDMIIENARKKAAPVASKDVSEDSDTSVMIIDEHAGEMPIFSDKVEAMRKVPPVASKVKSADRDNSIMIIDDPRELPTSSRKVYRRRKAPLVASKLKSEDGDDSVMMIDESTREKTPPIRSEVKSDRHRKKTLSSEKVDSVVTDTDFGIFMEILSDLSSSEDDDDDGHSN